MKVQHLRVGAIGTNCYLVYDEDNQQGVVIDPGAEGEKICQIIQEQALTIPYILLTHAHFDHILAVDTVKQATGAKVVLHEADLPFLKKETMDAFRPFVRNYQELQVDEVAQEGSTYAFGNCTATYLHTPGHTPGSCVIRIGDCLFTGDTMFRHECGRCDLPGGDFSQMLQSLKRISALERDYQVLPGHEAFSTLSEERKMNPYVLQANRA